MKLTVVIHTEDKDKLSRLFELIEKNFSKKYFSLYLHDKGYVHRRIKRNKIIIFYLFSL
jgi:hypothetical protein